MNIKNNKRMYFILDHRMDDIEIKGQVQIQMEMMIYVVVESISAIEGCITCKLGVELFFYSRY